MAYRRSKVVGVNRLRRKLRRVHPEVLRAVQDVVRDSLNRIHRAEVSLAPVDQGDLRRSIEVKLSQDKLAGLVGPGVRAAEIVRKKTGSAFGASSNKVNLRAMTKFLLMQFYKAYWAEFGTKGSPEHNVPPQVARPFAQPAYDLNRQWIRRELQRAVDRALERAASGRT